MLNDKKTIFALATAPGKSGVAVIRISGPDAVNSIKSLTKGSALKPRQATLRNLINPKTQELIDKAIIIYFPGPNSFTGEDIIELHIHGSRAVINILIKLLSDFNNFRIANPGEFAKRSFLNGRMDLTEAEGLSDLIEAETLIQQQQAARQMQGELSELYDNWKMKLIKMLALIEAYLDFPDDDIPDEVISEVNNEVEYLKNELALHLNDHRRGEILRNGIYVAILGSPNVGKSSLLNYLAKKDVAIVSNIAGTTRDVIEVNLDLAGYPVTIADTAGIRESQDLIEKEGITRALRKAEDADIKIIMLAADDDSSYKIKAMMDDNTIIIMNKIDLRHVETIAETSRDNHTGSFGCTQDDVLAVSVNQNIGLDLFLEKLTMLISEKFSPSSDPVITRERHRYHIKECYEALSFFDLNKPLELASEDLRIATRALGKIVGVIDVETILDEIFLKFCIGK
ncbi:MAG: tRNA uridine-5-carboxymethylaminomethyl(34) synthesis GTPase MnmE [Pseudomonadota bacterium]